MTQAIKPVLFHGESLQRALVALAVHGPLSVKQLQVIAHTRHIGRFKQLEHIGLITIWGKKGFSRKVGLSKNFPGRVQLRDLLREIGKHEGVSQPIKIKKKGLKIGPQSAATHILADHVFGGHSRTVILLALAHLGKVRILDLQRTLAFRRIDLIKFMTFWKSVGVLRFDDHHVELHRGWYAYSQLHAFRIAVTKQLPGIVPTAIKQIAVRTRLSKRGKFDWRQKAVARDSRPLGVKPSADGCPLLFGSDARRRILVTLAVNGTMRPEQLRRAAQISGSLEITEGDLVVRLLQSRKGFPQGLRINPAFPAHSQFIALLQKMDQRWPAQRVTFLRGPKSWRGAKTQFTWNGRIDRIFGSFARSETLLLLCALGPSTLKQIRRHMHSDIGEVMRALRMWRHYDIIRGGDGQKAWELNPDWFAAKELYALLKALIGTNPRYAGIVVAAKRHSIDHRGRRRIKHARSSRTIP